MSDEAMEPIVEMNKWLWQRFKSALDDVTTEEANWRPLPQANNISAIIRHLRIEAETHLAGLEGGEPLPVETTPNLQRMIDSTPIDFDENLKELEKLYVSFMALLEKATFSELRRRSASAYRNYPGERPQHLLSFHQSVHLTLHLGQIRMIRNLYRTTRGEPARFFPENPMFPKS